MKQKQSVEGAKRNAKPSIKKVGTMLGAGAMAVLTIGTISVYGLMDKAQIASKETNTATECKTTAYKAAAKENESSIDTSASNATVNWWKAGVEEYDFVEDVAATSTSKTTKKTETSKDTETSKETKKTTTSAETKKDSAKTTTEEKAETSKTTTKKSSDLQKIDDKTMYVVESVNMRTGPSKNKSVIKVLDAKKKVVCDAKTSDGWYRVNCDGQTGYCMAEFLTEKAPAKTTTTAAPKEKEPSGEAVISYTAEEFEMMSYVIQGEVGNCSEASKIAVSNVIINRVKSGRFGSSIESVLTAPNQFTAIYAYYNKTNTPSQNTRDCVERALNGEGASESNGAIYYYAPQYCGGSTASWFESLTFCMELEGQRYFKN